MRAKTGKSRVHYVWGVVATLALAPATASAQEPRRDIVEDAPAEPPRYIVEDAPADVIDGTTILPMQDELPATGDESLSASFASADLEWLEPDSHHAGDHCCSKCGLDGKTVCHFTRAPAMFGDFFGGGAALVSLSLQPMTITQNWADGSPFNTFVTNPIPGAPSFGNGADTNPAVPITVENQDTSQVLTTSTSVGFDASGDGQPDTYQIAEPLGSAPVAPGPGTIIYSGGTAVYTGVPAMPGVVPATQAADGSVGQGDNWNLIFSHDFIPSTALISVPPGADAAVRRIKLAENNSPQPRDRLIFDYNFFNDVITGIGDVNRYTLGIEKTFYDGNASLEIRLPLASTLGSDQFAERPGGKFTEIGNLTAIWKHILYQNDSALVSGGLGVAVPTADDGKLFLNGTQILRISSRAVRLLPFLAVLSDPGQRLFWQSFAQLDIDPNGNPVFGDVLGQNLDQIGVLQDPTLMFLDFSLGYWLYQLECQHGTCGIASLVELHYATTLQDSDAATGNGLSVRSYTQRYDTLNLTVGAAFVWSELVAIRPAMVIPLSTGDDRQFDYEAMVQMNVKY